MTTWLLDFARADGFGGFVRLDVPEGGGPATFWAYLVGVPGITGVIAVRDPEVPRPRQGLEIRSEGLWAELYCETPGEHWTFGLEAFGVRLDDPDDAAAPGGEIGERVAVGLDLEWEAGDADGGGLVHGEVLVGRGRYEIECPGRFVVGEEPPPVDGPVVARVVVRDVGERRLVRTAECLRWSPVVEG